MVYYTVHMLQCAHIIVYHYVQVMASSVTISEYGDEKLTICCRPSSRSWAMCFGLYKLCIVVRITLSSQTE